MIKRKDGFVIFFISATHLIATILINRGLSTHIPPIVGMIVGALIFSRGVSKRTLSKFATRRVFWSEEDEGYIATIPEFPYLSGYGDTEAEALQELNIALEASIKVYEDEGWPLPIPKK